MNQTERVKLIDELVRRSEYDALSRIHSNMTSCVRWCAKNCATPEGISAAKAAVLELSLIAEGGMVALGQYPVYGHTFGALARRARA